MNTTIQNNTNYSNTFRGIFSNKKVTEHNNVHYSHGLEEEVGTIHHIETFDYYPYPEETQKEIDEAVKAFSKRKQYSTDLVEHIEEFEVNIKKALPFTEKEAKKFMANYHIPENQFVKYIDLFINIFKK